jgi:hypothetical protein
LQGFHLKKIIAVFWTLILVFGCNSQSGLKEQTQIQSKETVNVENQNVVAWTKKLNADILKRRQFLRAIQGEFRGEFRSQDDSIYNIKVIILNALPDYIYDRERTLNELEFELQNLKLSASVVLWDPQYPSVALTCNVENALPDFDGGVVNLISERCPNAYQFVVTSDRMAKDVIGEAENPDEPHRHKKVEYREQLVQQIYRQKLSKIPALHGQIRRSSSPESIVMDLERVD